MKRPARGIQKAFTLLTILALLVMILPMAVMASKGHFPFLPEQASDRARQAQAARMGATAPTAPTETLPAVTEATDPQPVPETGADTTETTAAETNVTEAAPSETTAPAETTAPTENAPEETATDEADAMDDAARSAFVAARNAWAKSFGITPGHANLIDKLAFASGVDGMDATALLSFRELWGAKLISAENPLSIQQLQVAIRAARAAAGLPVEDEDSEDEEADEEESDEADLSDDDSDEADDDLLTAESRAVRAPKASANAKGNARKANR